MDFTGEEPMRRLIALLTTAVLLVAVLCACKSRAPRGEEQAAPQQEEGASQGEESREEMEPVPEEPPEESVEELGVQAVEKAVNDLLEAVQSGSRDRIREQIDYQSLLQLQDDQADSNLLAIGTRLQYEIAGVEVQENTATAVVKLTNVDMTKVLPAYLLQAQTMQYNNAMRETPLSEQEMEAEYESLFESLLEQNLGSILEQTVELQLIQDAGEWRAQSSEALRKGVFGDYWNAQSIITQGMENP